jgi:hypothetical protein
LILTTQWQCACCSGFQGANSTSANLRMCLLNRPDAQLNELLHGMRSSFSF